MQLLGNRGKRSDSSAHKVAGGELNQLRSGLPQLRKPQDRQVRASAHLEIIKRRTAIGLNLNFGYVLNVLIVTTESELDREWLRLLGVARHAGSVSPKLGDRVTVRHDRRYYPCSSSSSEIEGLCPRREADIPDIQAASPSQVRGLILFGFPIALWHRRIQYALKSAGSVSASGGNAPVMPNYPQTTILIVLVVAYADGAAPAALKISSRSG